MQQVIDKETSARISSLRFILAVLVVMIHNVLQTTKINGIEKQIEIPIAISYFRTAISGIIATSAVPLFTLIASYLLFMKERSYKDVIRTKTKTIVIPYLFWTLFSITFFISIRKIFSGFYQSPLLHFETFNWLEWIDVFWGLFTQRSPFPLVMQFWFLRDLLICLVLYKILKKIIDAFPIAFLGVLIALWIWFMQYSNVSFEVLFFFCLGYYVVKYNFTLYDLDKIKWIYLVPLVLLTSSIELITDGNVFIFHKINILLFCIFFLRLSKIFIKNKHIFDILSSLGHYSFFIYVAHEPALHALNCIWYRFIPMDGLFVLLQYFSTATILVSLLLATGIVARKHLPGFYGFISGNR